MKIQAEYQQKFKQALKNLNSEQREAVENIEGPVVVVAGPGTGKTQILTLRIVNIIDKLGADFAENILALTYTNAGVQAMKKRLAEFMGTELAYRVNIFTFHAFAEEQIKNYPEFFTDFAFARPIENIEKIEIIEELLNKGEWKKLKTFSSDFHYTKSIISAIDNLKSEAISPADFELSLEKIKDRILARKGEKAFYKQNRGGNKAGDITKDTLKKINEQTEKQKELLELYQLYQAELKKRKLYDFSDMILAVVQMAENNSDFRTFLQEKYFYLLIDEHQDTNPAQNKIIDLIASAPSNENKPNIFVVGDTKQAIYAFQGASLAEFKKIQEKYTDTKIINLKNNYRSSQNILDTAYSLIKADEKLEAKHKVFSRLENKIKVGEFFDKETELIYLAENIKQKIEAGADPNEIAVFYKKNKELDEVKEVLEKAGIPYSVNSKENILDNQEIKKMILLLSAIDNPYNDEILAKTLFISFLEFEPVDILKILEKLNNRLGTPMKNKSLLKIISSPEILKSLEIKSAEKFLAFSNFLNELKKEEQNLSFPEFFEKFIHRSNFLKHLLQSKNNISALKRLEKIFTEIKKQTENKNNYSLKDFLNYLEILKRYDEKIEVGKNDLLDGVNLMTAHSSKGLEFEYVYILNVIDNEWGGGRKQKEDFVLPINKNQNETDDIRRLFYVVLTRGKKEVQILWPKNNTNGKENLPSRFVGELNQSLIDYFNGENKNLTEKMKFYFQEREEKILSLFDQSYIKKLFLNTNLSVSALNNYFESPLKYFFRNLIRLPSTQTKSLIFGNIIHDALEVFFKAKGKRDILEIFAESIQKFSVLEKDYDNIYNHGVEVLTAYIENYQDDFNFEVLTEKKMKVEMKLTNGEKINIYGVIDKMEKLTDGKIRVVDYKSGKTFAEKDKKQKADLERQLIFYKFLIDKYYDEDRVSEGMLDFVEKSKKSGKFEREKRILTNEQVIELKKEIDNFAEDILSGDFLKREYKKDKNNEEYFELWQLLKNN